MRTFYEFFAGGGMARAGLGPNWRCTFANEIDAKKAATYTRNWGSAGLLVCDVKNVDYLDLPGRADLAWASFPCQDLSLAGDYVGLKGARSGTFWRFWRLIEALDRNDRAPALVVLENVCGALTSHGGRDFARIGSALVGSGYSFGAMVMDAVAFLPQSRPRLFIVATKRGISEISENLQARTPPPIWHTRSLVEAHSKLDPTTASKWIWWSMPAPTSSTSVLAELIEDEPQGVDWHTARETQRLLSLMSELNIAKVEEAKRSGRKMVGCIYKRTRPNENNVKVQRAEIRFDDISGCLRTPVGGSSRQIIMIVEGAQIRSRLISPRETARLMGLPDSYALPENYNEAYHLTGDGVAVPVVRHLAEHLLEPLLPDDGVVSTLDVSRGVVVG